MELGKEFVSFSMDTRWPNAEGKKKNVEFEYVEVKLSVHCDGDKS